MVERSGEKFSGYNKPKRTSGHSTKSHARSVRFPLPFVSRSAAALNGGQCFLAFQRCPSFIFSLHRAGR